MTAFLIGRGDQGRGARGRLREILTPSPLQIAMFDGDGRVGQALAQ
jgi:hypothetical protein